MMHVLHPFPIHLCDHWREHLQHTAASGVLSPQACCPPGKGRALLPLGFSVSFPACSYRNTASYSTSLPLLDLPELPLELYFSSMIFLYLLWRWWYSRHQSISLLRLILPQQDSIQWLLPVLLVPHFTSKLAGTPPRKGISALNSLCLSGNLKKTAALPTQCSWADFQAAFTPLLCQGTDKSHQLLFTWKYFIPQLFFEGYFYWMQPSRLIILFSFSIVSDEKLVIVL